jgi:hypothetical protein
MKHNFLIIATVLWFVCSQNSLHGEHSDGASTHRIVPENTVVSLLVDRNIHPEDMYSIQNAVRYIVDNLPANATYISFFDNQLGETRKITADNFDLFDDQFNVTSYNKILFDVAFLKFQQLCGLGDRTVDAEFARKINDEKFKKVLVVLTDGRVNANDIRTADNIQNFSDAVEALDDDPANKQRIEIHAIRYGERNDDVDFTLSYLCVDIRNENVKGGLYFADPVAFIENLKETVANITDYELLLPAKRGSDNIILQLVFGLTAGLLLLGFGFLFMQLVIPFVRFKIENFNHKYVRRYSFDDDSILKCHYCLSEIRDGDEIVTKCHHTVHKHCWIENGCKCTDYGRNCKRGKQFLYDTGQAFSATHRPYYTNWAMYGMIGGLVSWLIFHGVLYFFPAPLKGVTQWLVSVFGDNRDFEGFSSKIGALFVIGLLLGFILVLIFSVLNKYRQRKKDSLVYILLRSLTGAVFVFVSLLVSAVVFILCNADSTSILLDWIPWLLSGCAIGAALFLRTNIVFRQIVPGVVLSAIIGFVILLSGSLFGIYSVVIGLMFFGAGAGISFISARKIIHRYFLRFKGDKEEKIAIHKWMSIAGGSKEVSIGSSADATIRMTWDSHPSIKDIHVRLFFDRKNRLPCIKILSKDVTYNGVFAKNNEEYLLKDGDKFMIGSTVFYYVES